MKNPQKREEWWLELEPQQGASHVRLGMPNQDPIRWDKGDDPFPWAVIAVADGHGSLKCFRSERGASRAVDVAVEVGRAFLMSQIKEPIHPLVKSLAEEKLPRLILDRWQQEVDGDRAREPFSDAELSVLVSGDSPANRKAIDERPEVAYGTMLIACLITTGFVIYLQIGDGDVLSISSEGEVFRPALSTRHPVAGWELHPLETNTFPRALR